MSPRARNATSLLAAAAIAAIAALLVIGASGGRAAAPGCGAATDRTYLETAFTVARQINTGEHIGNGVTRALHTIETDQVLIDAVAADDVAVVHSEVLALLFNHEHIVRLRVLRQGRVLDDLGGPLVLARNGGSLRLDGRAVGSFVMSVQDDAGYRKLVERLVGAHIVMRYRGRTVMSDIAAGGRTLPARGAVTLAGVRYLVGSFSDARFPSGTLHIWLLFRAPPASLTRSSCGQVAANVFADVARRAYQESLDGPPVVPAESTLALDQALPQALAAADYSGAAKIVRGMVTGGGFARLQVSVGGRLIADAGTRAPVIAPLHQAIHDASGGVVGTALFGVQNALGYTILARALTGVHVLVRTGRAQLAGSIAGPSSLPTSGPVRYRGVRYYVASFTGTAFPSSSIRIYVLAAA
jgi:hypothetical protein